jgi:hypothetical protein
MFKSLIRVHSSTQANRICLRSLKHMTHVKNIRPRRVVLSKCEVERQAQMVARNIDQIEDDIKEIYSIMLCMMLPMTLYAVCKK